MSGMRRDRVDAVRSADRRRLTLQAVLAVLFNGYLVGFARGRIYDGDLKLVCVPVLNCYSCPGALGSCPIGSLQAVAGGHGRSVSFYVLGTLMLFGTLAGRLVCGFMCPFGLIQDLLHRIPVRKIRVPERADRVLRYLKYVMLFVVVMLLPAVITNRFGIGAPYFCKFICPAGTLEGGIPLMITNPTLRAAAGLIFSWKMFLLVCFIIGSIFISRCWCKYLCPLGAFYALFNRVSLAGLAVDETRCTGCGTCSGACPMDIDVIHQINGPECIKCGRCKAACPHSVIARTGLMTGTSAASGISRGDSQTTL